MSKATDYISEYTRRCSNEIYNGLYENWITPDHAKNAIAITKLEMIEKACKCYCDDICEKSMCGMCFHKHVNGQIKDSFKYNECNELKMIINAMKDE